MEEYMGDTEDPQILQANFHELMADFMFMIPALQVAHFQHEYICDRGLTAIGETRPVVPGELCDVLVPNHILISSECHDLMFHISAHSHS
jgi:hypothetical protein